MVVRAALQAMEHRSKESERKAGKAEEKAQAAEERVTEVEKELLQQLDEANEEAEEASDARLEAEEALKRAEDRVAAPCPRRRTHGGAASAAGVKECALASLRCLSAAPVRLVRGEGRDVSA